jgi:hypothetical protein
MAATIERLLPIDEQALLKAYVEGSSEPAHAAAIYDTLEVPANERSGQRSFSLKSPRSDGSIIGCRFIRTTGHPLFGRKVKTSHGAGRAALAGIVRQPIGRESAEELAEVIRDGLAEEGLDIRVHSNTRTGWDVAINSDRLKKALCSVGTTADRRLRIVWLKPMICGIAPLASISRL